MYRPIIGQGLRTWNGFILCWICGIPPSRNQGGRCVANLLHNSVENIRIQADALKKEWRRNLVGTYHIQRWNPGGWKKERRILELRYSSCGEWSIIIIRDLLGVNLVRISRPITRLLSPKTGFEWTKECDAALRYIRQSSIKGPVMQNPDWTKAFIINPSANTVTVAWIFLQNNESDRDHPIYYASLAFNQSKLTPRLKSSW